MRLVEVICTDIINDVVFNMMTQYVKAVSKCPVSCSDTPSFFVNRLLIPYLYLVPICLTILSWIRIDLSSDQLITNFHDL
jgi:3-hydroxyacyl-CoA dehydrogenase